jgi:hypothetical protein
MLAREHASLGFAFRLFHDEDYQRTPSKSGPADILQTIRKWIRILVSGAVAGLALPFLAVQLVWPYLLRHTEACEIATRCIVSDPLIRKTVGSQRG